MSRYHTILDRVEKSQTGLNAAIHVHVSHDRKGAVRDIRFSQRWHDDTALDRILAGLANRVTEAVRKGEPIQPLFTHEDPTLGCAFLALARTTTRAIQEAQAPRYYGLRAIGDETK